MKWHVNGECSRLQFELRPSEVGGGSGLGREGVALAGIHAAVLQLLMGDAESRTRTLPYLRSQFNAQSFLSSFAKHNNTQHYFHASLHHFPKCYGLQLHLKRLRFLKYSFISRERRGKNLFIFFFYLDALLSISYVRYYIAVEAFPIEQFDFLVFPSLICSFTLAKYEFISIYILFILFFYKNYFNISSCNVV